MHVAKDKAQLPLPAAGISSDSAVEGVVFPSNSGGVKLMTTDVAEQHHVIVLEPYDSRSSVNHSIKLHTCYDYVFIVSIKEPI